MSDIPYFAVDHSNRTHPGPGWVALDRTQPVRGDEVIWDNRHGRWRKTMRYGGDLQDPRFVYFRYDPAAATRTPHEDD